MQSAGATSITRPDNLKEQYRACCPATDGYRCHASLQFEHQCSAGGVSLNEIKYDEVGGFSIVILQNNTSNNVVGA